MNIKNKFYPDLGVYPKKMAIAREYREGQVQAEHTERELELLNQQHAAEADQSHTEFTQDYSISDKTDHFK